KHGPFEAAEDAIAAKHGGRAEIEKRETTLFLRAFGHFFIAFGDARFDYSLTLPGKIVAANGEILSAQRVRWRFPTYHAFPFGYPMTCRSLLPLMERQKPLLGRALLVSREDMLQFVELVEDQKP